MAPSVLTLGPDGDEWSDSSPGRFIPGEITPGILCVGGVLGPKTALEAVE
jgi:hypothetical protein